MNVTGNGNGQAGHDEKDKTKRLACGCTPYEGDMAKNFWTVTYPADAPVLQLTQCNSCKRIIGIHIAAQAKPKAPLLIIPGRG